MVFRRLFVPLTGEAEDAIALAAAGRLADDFKAHLDAMLVKPDPSAHVPLSGYGRLANEIRTHLIKSSEAAWEQIEEDLRKQFEAIAEAEGLARVEAPRGPGAASAKFDDITRDQADDRVLRLSRASDLIVFGEATADTTDRTKRLRQRLLIQSGRPCLFIPESGLPEEINRVGIAWDGSVEATRSLASGMAFLLHATKVDVVTVTRGDENDARSEDIAEYLDWHGIPNEAHNKPAYYESVGDHFAGLGEELGWDMIIMGAYHSSRLLEILLSGPTKDILKETNVPVLQCH